MVVCFLLWAKTKQQGVAPQPNTRHEKSAAKLALNSQVQEDYPPAGFLGQSPKRGERGRALLTLTFDFDFRC